MDEASNHHDLLDFFSFRTCHLAHRISKSSQLISFGSFVNDHRPGWAYLSSRTDLPDRIRSWHPPYRSSVGDPAASGPAGIVRLVVSSSESSLALLPSTSASGFRHGDSPRSRRCLPRSGVPSFLTTVACHGRCRCLLSFASHTTGLYGCLLVPMNVSVERLLRVHQHSGPR